MDFDDTVEAINASKINQGVSTSNLLTINYDEGFIERYEGQILRVRVGNFDDGTYGMRAYDASGNTVIDSTA